MLTNLSFCFVCWQHLYKDPPTNLLHTSQSKAVQVFIQMYFDFFGCFRGTSELTRTTGCRRVLHVAGGESGRSAQDLGPRADHVENLGRLVL